MCGAERGGSWYVPRPLLISAFSVLSPPALQANGYGETSNCGPQCRKGKVCWRWVYVQQHTGLPPLYELFACQRTSSMKRHGGSHQHPHYPSDAGTQQALTSATTQPSAAALA